MNGSSKCIAQSCAEAATGYAAAATAAYTELASQALDFWCTALSGLADPATQETKDKAERAAAAAKSEPAFGLSAADWNPMSWFDPRRFEGLWNLNFHTPPGHAMLAVANTVPLRGTSASWGMAKVMIDSGVPRSVAWPAAEANAAALKAADTASNGLRSVVAHFHSDSGYASVARGMTPTMVALAMTFGTAMGPSRLMGNWT
ncbi:MAG: hypothetical protein ABL901_11575 [Hyphomicrobiaceae bacterium]